MIMSEPGGLMDGWQDVSVRVWVGEWLGVCMCVCVVRKYVNLSRNVCCK